LGLGCHGKDFFDERKHEGIIPAISWGNKTEGAVWQVE
jgi:hypothetical protein